MLTVRIIYLDGTEDIKAVLDLSEICLDGVMSLRVIRSEKAA
jgi:hypothetical protein